MRLQEWPDEDILRQKELIQELYGKNLGKVPDVPFLKNSGIADYCIRLLEEAEKRNLTTQPTKPNE